MNKVLEIEFEGWTATPRMPYILSGNAVCLPVPTYSMLLGVLGCCLGRTVESSEVSIGFRYEYDTVGKDLEKRQRLEFDGRRVKSHAKGSDAYSREFHTLPKLTVWINKIDWLSYFENPVGTPCLGQSQDLLRIASTKILSIEPVDSAEIYGTLLPFENTSKIAGQLIQLSESFTENEEVGSGRTPTVSKVFIAIPHENKQVIKFQNLFHEVSNSKSSFYMHTFSNNSQF
ncbi:CRISPR-associated protein, Cas5t family [Spirosomataceae bacterium TFI 002]|nr:CRISPR-associated protein, Cas5t family [Spirosomataceae bacterium TFI 002]